MRDRRLHATAFASQRDQYNQWRQCEVISSLFAAMGIACQIADYELRYHQEREYWDCRQRPAGEFYRWLCVLFTVVAACFQVFRHHAKHMWELFKARKRFTAAEHHTVKTSVVSSSLALDLLLLAVFPYPNVSGTVTFTERCMVEEEWVEVTVCYTVAEALYVLMFARLYLLLRCGFLVFGMTDRHSRYISAQFGIQANSRFTIRSLLRFRPYLTLLLLSAPVSFILALLFRVFERPYMDCSGLDFEPYYNALWLAAMTITTVNYADFYPSTHLGRVVAMAGGMWGLFLISLMVLVMARNFALTWRQQKVLTHITTTRHAARVVIAALKLSLAQRQRANISEKQAVLRACIADFKENRALMTSLYEETCTEVTDIKPDLDRVKQRLGTTEAKVDKMILTLRALTQ